MDNPIRLFLINYYKKGGNMKNISGFLVAAAACVALSANAYAGDGSGFFVGASAEKYSTTGETKYMQIYERYYNKVLEEN